jgi:hypothetical protein
MTNFRVHDEQTVHGLRKITWASVFLFPYTHIHICTVYTENGTNRKMAISICLPQMENGNGKKSLFSLVGKQYT